MNPQRLTLDNPAFAGVRLKGVYTKTNTYRKRQLDYVQDFSGRSKSPITIPPKPTQHKAERAVAPTSVDKMSSTAQPLHQHLSNNKMQDIYHVPPKTVISSNDRTTAQIYQSKNLGAPISEKVTDNGSVAGANSGSVSLQPYARTVSSEQNTKTKSNRRYFNIWQPALLYGMAGVIFVLGIVIAVGGFQANNHVAAQVKQLQKSAAGVGSKKSTSAVAAPPSAVKPSVQSISSYTVAPDMPRYLSIPKLNVFSRVLSMGINDRNQLDAPKNIHDAGWYNDSSKPGLPGAMLIDGHSGIGKTNGIFHNAAKLSRGDSIIIERGDGEKFTYIVSSVEVLHVDAVDMSTMVTPAEKANEGLNIITCTGKQIPGTTSLDERVLVRSVRST